MPRQTAATATDFQERYDVLLDIGRILTATLEPAQLYRTIYEQASRVLETTGFYISLYDPEDDQATVAFYADRGVIDRPGTTYRGSESRAIREREPILEDLSAPDRAIMLLGPESDEEVTRSVIAAPMIHEQQVLGVISAQSYRAGAYSPDDLKLLAALADLAAVAIWNARTVRALEQQSRELEQMVEVSRAITSSLELGEVLERIVHATRELVESDGSGVWLLRPDGRAELAIAVGEITMPVGTSFDVPDRLRQQFRDSGQPIIADPTQLDPALPAEIAGIMAAGSGIGVPLVADGELIGALSVSHVERHSYPPRVVQLLQRLAVHAAVAVANARLHEQVRTLSLTDPLTRLPNRRHMDMFLAKELAAAERGRHLTVVLFDLNDFKKYNDTAGHQAGDAVLRRFAELLQGETRAMNLAARYGGDEFVCILSDTEAEGGAIHAGRIMKAVREDPLMGKVGVSAGVATYEDGMTTSEDLIRKADEALYRAKSHRDGEVPTS